MKILHTADWHIGPFPGPEKNGVNLREQDTYACIEAMFETAKQEQPDFAVVSGDVFHTAKVWSNRALQEAHKAIGYIKALSEICHVVVLYGTPNHDLREQFVMLMDYFKDNPRVSISTIPERLEIKNNGETIQICTLPGFDRGVYRAKFPGLSRDDENQVFTEELNNIVLGLKAQCDTVNPTVLISHYTVPGCNLESGQTTFFSQVEPVITPETLAAAAFDLVALGHVHKPQAIPGCRNTFYSGAINAFNFNDEGQERGFWIHELTVPHGLDWELESCFYTTPYREFLTIRLDDGDITAINNGGSLIYHANVASGVAIEDKIVRVLYSCSDEANKAFNKALLEKRLYADGAFWVSDIMPANIGESTVKDEFVEDSSPEENLREYLSAKNYDEQRMAKIIETARPIIAEAVANSTTARFTGIFEPVEIEVTNYRNYEKESFNFSDISFCTINGINGAGKSSLFMDAILDCLYEEPREGDLTGWIRNNEDVKGGSITFTFKIGDKTFRVVRTRVKSGKATLNLSEFNNGEWLNRSREKMRDTQDEIINILGMDSLTLKSCVLIMQDQYGIFLQSDKEDRMTVLASLLGLGIYGDMETISRNQLTEVNRQVSQNKSEIDKLAGSIAEKGSIEDKLQIEVGNLACVEEEFARRTAERDGIQVMLSVKLEAAARALKHRESITALATKKASVEAGMGTQRGIISNADIILSQTREINAGVTEYAALLEQEKTALIGKATYEAKQREQRLLNDAVTLSSKTISDIESEKSALAEKRRPLDFQLSKESSLAASSTRYWDEKNRLSEMEKGSEQYIELSASIEKGEKALNEVQSAYSAELAGRVATYRGYEEKTKLLMDTGCIDVVNAKCKFLADAQHAKTVIDDYQRESSAWKDAQLKKIETYKTALASYTEKRAAIGYDPEAIRKQKEAVRLLEALHMEYEKLGSVKEQIRLIDGRLTAINGLLSDTQKKLADARIEAVRINEELLLLKAAADEYDALRLKIMVASAWLEKEKMLPVAREQKDTAEKRLQELTGELSEIAVEILAKQQELNDEMTAAEGSDELQAECDSKNNAIREMQAFISETTMRIGAIKQQLADIDKKADEVNRLQERANVLAGGAVILDELKIAFSQDGIPHNIIRSIVPLLASKANSILGQMTGGRMGLEFATDKVLKSNKKEVVTLDILIEEYGKGKLPYLSKSGGEKVKAALSAILALAEIKTSRSGIQLGMLFIDEPPFLDSSGMQAYCDALEAIQQRYGTIKIMAITHDPAMKARFPQSIDVIKTENGSKVVIG